MGTSASPLYASCPFSSSSERCARGQKGAAGERGPARKALGLGGARGSGRRGPRQQVLLVPKACTCSPSAASATSRAELAGQQGAACPPHLVCQQEREAISEGCFRSAARRRPVGVYRPPVRVARCCARCAAGLAGVPRQAAGQAKVAAEPGGRFLALVWGIGRGGQMRLRPGPEEARRSARMVLLATPHPCLHHSPAAMPVHSHTVTWICSLLAAGSASGTCGRAAAAAPPQPIPSCAASRTTQGVVIANGNRKADL